MVRVVTEVKLSYESVIHEPITRVMLISGLDIVKINSKSASYISIDIRIYVSAYLLIYAQKTHQYEKDH